MKTFLIAISLALNLAIVALVASRPKLAPAFRDFFSFAGSSEVSNPVKSPANKTSASQPATPANSRPLWASLASEDPATFIARLRAAGFPASLIRALVSSEINARYNARLRAFTDPDPNTPYWKGSASFTNRLTPDRMEEYTRIQQERARLLRDLFKDEFFASAEVSAAQRRQYGNLPPEKIAQLQRIEDDYTEMQSLLSAATKGVLLREDREKMALLAREKQADFAGILSPAESADYTVRSSPITRLLASQFGSFEPTESEFRAIFHVQQTLNEQFPLVISGGSISSNADDGRRAVHQQLEEQLKASMGEARYADYTRETDREFIQLDQLAQRDKLPPAASLQAFNVRETVARESNRIFDDPSLDPAQKQASLQSLAQNARSQLLAALGPTSGPAYVKVADQWLTNVERGGAVSFNRNTGGFSIATSSSNTGAATALYLGSSSPSFRRLPPPTVQNPPK